MPYEIDNTAANTAASSANTSAHNAADTELSANSVNPDPVATLQSLANETHDRKASDADETLARAQGDIAVAKFVGQDAVGDATPNYTRSPQLVLPVNTGDTLETAIAKLLVLVNRHPIPSGVILPLGVSKTLLQVNQMDLTDIAQAAASVSTSNGPFWLLCDGTTQGGQVSPDYRGRMPVGWTNTLTTAQLIALAIPALNVGDAAGRAGILQRVQDIASHAHTINHTHADGTIMPPPPNGAGYWTVDAANGAADGGDVTDDITNDGVAGVVHVTIPTFTGSSANTPILGTFNSGVLSVHSTAGLLVGDYIQLTHASIASGVPTVFKILTITTGNHMTLSPSPGAGPYTNVLCQSLTPALNPSRGVLWIMRSNRVQFS